MNYLEKVFTYCFLAQFFDSIIAICNIGLQLAHVTTFIYILSYILNVAILFLNISGRYTNFRVCLKCPVLFCDAHRTCIILLVW